MPVSRMQQAVVIGASMSGLLAARVLADHYSQVTLVERDVLPQPGEPRKGVPQGRHLHVLLSHGRDVLERFFPGLTQEIVAQGGYAGDLTETAIWFSDGAYSRIRGSGLVTLESTRPLLEGTIYRRVCELSNVTVLENHDVTGLLSEKVGPGPDERVTGVRVVDRGQQSGGLKDERPLPADLVVDAGGRGTRSLAWLEALGYPRPAEEHIKMNLTYTTRFFRRLPEHAGGRQPVVILASPRNPTSGILQVVEGDRWLASLAGMLGHSAPMDLAGFIDFARQLSAPDVYNVVKAAEPLGEAVQYKYPASQRRYFEKLSRFPQGLLLVGDTICSFNPIYGQGMTVAASEAAMLDDLLRTGLATRPGGELARAFFRRASKLLDSPWMIAAGSDLAYSGVEGKRSPGMGLVRRYLTRLIKVCNEDFEVNLAFQRVTNLIEPPSSLFKPGIMMRVLFGKTK